MNSSIGEGTPLSQSKEPPVRLLIVEDNPRDLRLLLALLEKSGDRFTVDAVDSLRSFQESVAAHAYDAILCDYNLRDWTASDALAVLHEAGKPIPFVLVSGSLPDEAAVELIQQGAADYVLKDRMARLPSAIRRAIQAAQMRERRQQAEEALRQSEARLRTILETEPACISVFAPDGTLVDMNAAGLAFLEIGCLEEAGKPSDYPTYFPEQWEEFRSLVERAVRGEKGSLEYVLKGKKGAHHWMQGHAVPLQLIPGEPPGALVISYDVTERKQAEEKIRQSEELLRKLIDGLGLSMFVGLLTPEGILVEANRPALEVAGLKPEDVLGKPLEETYWLSYSEQVKRQIREAIERAVRGESSRFDLTIRVGEGQFIVIDFSLQPLRDETGKVIYLVPSGMDITKRVQAMEALAESERRLKELTGYLQSLREEERTRIAREVHDDLGQGLTAIKFDLSCLGQKLPKNGGALHQQVQSLLGLVDSSVETVRRIASDLRPGVLDDLGLAAAIEWHAQEFERRTGIACALQLDEEPAVEGDAATALFRIFQESLTNVARHAQATRVEARLLRSGDAVMLEICDNGVGIPPEPLRRPRSLGLLGMKERAEAIGGSFTIEGAAGAGTVVRVRLP